MDRRTFLGRTTVLAAAALAGCTSNGTGDGDGETDGDSGSGDNTGSDGNDDGTTTSDGGSGKETKEIAERSFERTDDCDQSGSATVTRDGETVVVKGCISGRNGCSVAVLDSAEYDADADRLSVVVATTVEREDDEACTQALVNRGYEVRIRFEGGTPGTVDVVHDGPDGRTTVTSANSTE